MTASRSRWFVLPVLLLILVGLTGCTALREVANLRKVQFQIDRVAQPQLAGIDLSGFQSYQDLRTSDVLRLGAALSDGNLPMTFTLYLQATNPETNSVNARLSAMDWTLLLQDKETVTGRFQEQVVLPPGQPQDIGVRIELDLVRFFEDNLRGLVNLASAIVQGDPPQTVKLRVQPTVQTRFGPVEYPSPITVVSKEVGGASSSP